MIFHQKGKEKQARKGGALEDTEITPSWKKMRRSRDTVKRKGDD